MPSADDPHRGAAPLRPLRFKKPTNSQAFLSQEPLPHATQVFSEGPTAETLSIAAPSMVPNLQDTVEDESLRSKMEEQAVATSGKSISTSTTRSRGRQQRGRLESQDDSVLLEFRDTMKTSTELLSNPVDLDRAPMTRNPLIA